MAKRTGYHHGDLRRALLDASLALVNESGVGALSLREVARKAGVSHNAPYHHFPDKGHLLAAIAIEGCDKLYAEMERAASAHPDDALARLQACGIAYVRFALASPAHFRVMFRPELADPEANPELAAASSRTFDWVVSAVIGCQQEGFLPAGDPGPFVLTCWSATHGLASLWLDGPLSRDQKGLGKSAEKMAETLVTTLATKLATVPPAKSGKADGKTDGKDASPKRTKAHRAGGPAAR